LPASAGSYQKRLAARQASSRLGKDKEAASEATLQAKHGSRLPFAAHGLEFNTRPIVLFEKGTDLLSRSALRMMEDHKSHSQRRRRLCFDHPAGDGLGH